MRDLIAKYGWLAEYPDLAWTVAVIKGRTADEVVRIYGGDPSQPIGELTFEEAWVAESDFGQYFHLQTLVVDDQVLAIENNGWSGSLPEIARRCSAAGGQFMSVYWGPTASQVMAAVDGVVTAYFDPLYVEPGEGPGDDERYPTWLVPEDFATTQPKAGSLALLEQQTGIAFSPAWMNTRIHTYRIPDPDRLLAGVDRSRLP